MPTAHEIVRGQRTRRHDRWGHGHFGAPRGTRIHQGLDIAVTAGEQVLSPIDGVVVREAIPYANDPTYRGTVIRGTGEWEGYEVKLLYVVGLFCGTVRAGQTVGHAQDLTEKYDKITNHVHVEARFRGQIISPSELWQMCF